MLAKRILMGIILLFSTGALTVRGADQEAPSLELLEFLGNWETADGKWVDPTELEEMALPQGQQQEGAEEEGKNEEKGR